MTSVPNKPTEAVPAAAPATHKVGAGDTFTAGLITALERAKLLTKAQLGAISGSDLDAALAFAARAAAVTVSRPGCDPPWASELA